MFKIGYVYCFVEKKFWVFFFLDMYFCLLYNGDSVVSEKLQ